jgi:diguanylate cyclase (GGDEF)-like protein
MSLDEGEAQWRHSRRAASAPHLAPPPRAAQRTKSSLLALNRALQRVLASSLATGLLIERDAAAPPLVVAFFQHRSYFLAEQERFATYGALGATTIVGFPGDAGPLPEGVEHLDLSGRPELEDSWVFAVFDGALAGVIVAVDDKGLTDGPTLEASRRFVVRWSVEVAEALVAIRQLLMPLRPRLDRRVLALVEGALRRSEEADPAESAGYLLTLVQTLAPLSEVPAELRGRDEEAERDLLTGLRNRAFLEHYLPRGGESAARVAALLIDVDDLGALNERHGHAAGDAALVGVANVLGAERRPGDVLVRYGEDEFLMLAPVEGSEGAVQIAERLVVAVRAARLDYPFEDETVTVSIGVTVADPAELPMARLTDALRLAKLLGKNVARLAD